MITIKNVPNTGLIGQPDASVRRFSVLLARWPILPAQVIEESCFTPVLVKANDIETAKKRLQDAMADAKIRIASIHCGGNRQLAYALRDTLRSLTAGRLSSLEVHARVLSGIDPGLDQALNEVGQSSQALCMAEIHYRNAMAAAIAADRHEIRSLIDTPSFSRALGISNPELLDLADRYLATDAGDRRSARRVARTLRRLIWRASARPTPFGLLASTTLAIADAAPPDRRGTSAPQILCSVRPTTTASLMQCDCMADTSGLPLHPASLEVVLWSQAFEHPSMLPAAFIASELRTAAEAVESGEQRVRLSRLAARSLVVEAVSVEKEAIIQKEMGESLAVLAQLGSGLSDMRETGSFHQLRAWFDAEFPGRDCVPLAAFSAFVETRLVKTVGAQVARTAPLSSLLLQLNGPDASPDPYRKLVQSAIESDVGRIVPSDVAALSHVSSNPRPIAAKLRPIATCDDGWVMALRHFGGTSMSYMLRYAHLASAVMPDFVDRLQHWFSRWPDTVQVLVHPDRRMARVTVLPCCSPQARATDQTPDALCVRRMAGTLVVCRGREEHSLSLVTGELYDEAALPFVHRLALLLARGRPSALESILEAIGAIVAERLHDRKHEMVVLPRVCVGNHLELAPAALIVPAHALTDAARDPRTVWRLLQANGVSPGPAEVRPLNRAIEPAVLDMRHPDGVAWLGRMASQNGSLIVVPLQKAYIGRNGVPTHVDLCVELTHIGSRN